MDKVILAYKKGFRVTSEGAIVGSNGGFIKGYLHKNGYVRISFRCNNKHINFLVHRLQAFQKFGLKMFDKGIEVRHLNGNPSDNSWDNIAIGTHSENMRDVPKHIRLEKSLHATSFVRKHDKNAIIKFHSENNSSYKLTMEAFNISSKGTLHYILNSK